MPHIGLSNIKMTGMSFSILDRFKIEKLRPFLTFERGPQSFNEIRTGFKQLRRMDWLNAANGLVE